MSKKSILEIFRLPKQCGTFLFIFSMILFLIPYLPESIDFGIFKVPRFPDTLKTTLSIVGPLVFIFVLGLFFPFIKQDGKSPPLSGRSVDSHSKYTLQNIAEIVKIEMANYGFNIDGIKIGDRLHINDLERICTKTLFSTQSAEKIKKSLHDARAKAFSIKYAEPKEDEKLIEISKIKIQYLKPWDDYFMSFLKDLGVEDFNHFDILDVGIGNGHAEEPFLKQIHSFKAVDISHKALSYANQKYKRQMTHFICAAENLDKIENSSIDMYLSLRTYQSSLFDKRVALHEAYRVLANGGFIVLSIPIMFLKKGGEALSGLIPPGSTEPSMEYAKELVNRIKEYLNILNFHDIKIDERSPFEIYIAAKR